jgi:hypothetical protein
VPAAVLYLPAPRVPTVYRRVPLPALQCVVTARLGRDQLTVQGLAFDQPTSVFAITGGTGRWRNAGGQVVVRSVSDTVNKLTLFISDLG